MPMVHDFVRHLPTLSPQIIEAEDLVNPNIDELSVLTYVSLLKNATPTIGIVPIGLLSYYCQSVVICRI